MAERGGDTTMYWGNVENIDVAVVADAPVSADPALSAVFALILEQILEQEVDVTPDEIG